MPEPSLQIRTVSGDHPGSSWLSRFLLFPALAIILVLMFRVIYSEANFFGEKYKNRGVLVDNMVVNLAVTSSLFVLSAVVLQGAIKKAARDELAAFVSKLLVEDLAQPIRVQLLTPLTGDSSKETSLIVVRNFLSVSGLFIRHLNAATKSDSVRILNTWIPQLADGIDKDDFIQAIKNAWEKGVSIKILMIDPYGHTASLRSESVSKNPSSSKDIDVRLQVKTCLHELNEIAESFNDQDQNYKNSLEVKLSRTLPSVSIYSTKDLTLVGTFLHAKKAIEGPQFAVSTSAFFVEDAYSREFDLIWESPTSMRYLLCNQGGSKDVLYQLDMTRGNDPFNDK